MSLVADDARFWDRIARDYAAKPVADPTGYERTLEHTRRYLRGDETVFEFGCGTGTTALKLAPFVGRVVASDISGEMIAIAREKAEIEGRSNADFEVGTPDAAHWPDEAFDVVIGLNVLHLVALREPALKGIRRVLKPGGLFISKTACLKDMNPIYRIVVSIMRLIGKAPFVAFLSAEELERSMTAAGFTIVERSYHASRGKDARPFLVARKQ